jgi:hypothetical protein
MSPGRPPTGTPWVARVPADPGTSQGRDREHVELRGTRTGAGRGSGLVPRTRFWGKSSQGRVWTWRGGTQEAPRRDRGPGGWLWPRHAQGCRLRPGVWFVFAAEKGVSEGSKSTQLRPVTLFCTSPCSLQHQCVRDMAWLHFWARLFDARRLESRMVGTLSTCSCKVTFIQSDLGLLSPYAWAQSSHS